MVVSLKEGAVEDFMNKANAAGVTATELGAVTTGAITVNGQDWGNIVDWKGLYDTAIEKYLSAE